ncbi:Calcium-binding protein [Taenia crassiceps]|uniref:Calcium-binding protein n=1 Tax=Taenia crassiceps TaxID=6207 RepID=A0ABR4QDD3_9CEST
MPCSEVVKELLKQLDRDGSGTVSAKELLAALQCDDIKEEQVKDFIKKIDKNGDGELNVDELMDFFNSIGL